MPGTPQETWNLIEGPQGFRLRYPREWRLERREDGLSIHSADGSAVLLIRAHGQPCGEVEALLSTAGPNRFRVGSAPQQLAGEPRRTIQFWDSINGSTEAISLIPISTGCLEFRSRCKEGDGESRDALMAMGGSLEIIA